VDYASAEVSFVPSMEVPLDEDNAKKVMRIVDALEDSDDVQNVYSNADIPDEILAKIG
jgi:transcriptional/translational regulatory protein YebC/TACO1